MFNGFSNRVGWKGEIETIRILSAHNRKLFYFKDPIGNTIIDQELICTFPKK